MLLKRIAVQALILVMLAAWPLASLAAGPTEALSSAIDGVIEVLKDDSLKGESKRELRREKMRHIIEESFSFEEMAKRSLGKHWRDRTPDERDEFVRIFARLIENSYIGKIEGYTNERVVYESERIIKRAAMVDTKVITSKGTEIPIKYKMMNNGDGWMVYDIVIEGVSLVSNYRTQFGKVLSSSPYSELVAQIKSKL